MANARRVSAQRVAYGARCTWWDSIEKVGSKPSGLPCCPHCGGVLFEVENEAEWWAGVDQAERDGRAGYRVFIEWARGKCYPSFTAAETAFAEAS